MGEIVLTELRKKYLELGDCSEEDIKIKIVRPLFENLGYQEKWFRYEYPAIRNKKITDITFVKNEKAFMVIEVKKSSRKGLIDDDLYQLLNYLNIKNIEWGILTNGKNYLLVNNRINDAEYKDKIVLDFNLLDFVQASLLENYSYNSIFENRITYYLKYLTQYKVYYFNEKDNYNSWVTYKSTIEKYFEFLSKKYGFRKLDHLNADDFKSFILNDIRESQGRIKKITSRATIINKFRHISSLYELFLKNNDEIVKSPFRYLTEEQMLDGIDCKDKEEILGNFNDEIINQYFRYYDNHTYDAERNKLIFLLSLYAGLSRDNIRYLKTTDIDDESKALCLHERKVPLPLGFYNRLKNYIENMRDKNARVDYIFYSNYGDYAGQPLVKNSINAVFNKAAVSSNKSLNICPKQIRKMLIRRLFEADFTIEEIVTALDLDIKKVGDYVTKEEIIEKTNLNRLCDIHPFKHWFETI